MAEQTTTTKQAAVWKPPRLRILGLGADTGNGSKRHPLEEVWEFSPDAAYQGTCAYRMPLSGESTVPFCQTG